MRLARTHFILRVVKALGPACHRGDAAARRRERAAFTLAEVLAALVFMAILIPVTVRAIQVASRAGQVGERKVVATRIAERVMNELLVTGMLYQNSAMGQVEEGSRLFRWTMRSEPWTEDSMNLVTVHVAYDVQGQEYEVDLSTLVDTAQWQF